MKAVKKIASVALPVAAAFVPGLQPLAYAALVGGAGVLGSKIGGASWGDALKHGALSGLTAGIAPIAGNAFSALAPETAGALGINGGYNTVLGQGFGGALSGAAPSAVGATGALSSGTENFLAGLGAPEQISPALSAADPSLVASGAASSPSSGGFFSGALSNLKDNPFKSAAYLMTAGNALSGMGVNGEQNQAQILAAQKAKQAQDAAFSKQTTDMLNAAQTGRSPTVPAVSDYYTYGTRPEATFFSQAKPIQYGALSNG